MTLHRGGCHCGSVKFELDAPAVLEVAKCNCSICEMSGYLHLFVSRNNFRLLQGEESITTYTFNTGVAQHTFCRNCGIKSFYVPRSHPNGLSINVNCLDNATIESISETPFDGRNWEKNVAELSPLND
jgi:hypothetical protein